MLSFGPQPPQDLLDELPDEIPQEAGVAAWSRGYLDGVEDNQYEIFVEQPDIQPLYKNGYDRGKANREIKATLGWGENAEESQEKPWHPRQWIPRRLHKPVDFVIYSDDLGKSLLYWTGAIYLTIRIARSLVGRD